MVYSTTCEGMMVSRAVIPNPVPIVPARPCTCGGVYWRRRIVSAAAVAVVDDDEEGEEEPAYALPLPGNFSTSCSLEYVWNYIYI